MSRAPRACSLASRPSVPALGRMSASCAPPSSEMAVFDTTTTVGCPWSPGHRPWTSRAARPETAWRRRCGCTPRARAEPRTTLACVQPDPTPGAGSAGGGLLLVGATARTNIAASPLSACRTSSCRRSPSGHTMWSMATPWSTAKVNTGAMSKGMKAVLTVGREELAEGPLHLLGELLGDLEHGLAQRRIGARGDDELEPRVEGPVGGLLPEDIGVRLDRGVLVDALGQRLGEGVAELFEAACAAGWRTATVTSRFLVGKWCSCAPRETPARAATSIVVVREYPTS